MANLSGYNFAYLDEQTKRMIRRAIASPKRRSPKIRSLFSRCRSRNRCALSSRAKRRPALCTRWRSTA